MKRQMIAGVFLALLLVAPVMLLAESSDAKSSSVLPEVDSTSSASSPQAGSLPQVQAHDPLPAASFPAQAGSREMEHVLVLHSYQKGLTWTDSEDYGIRLALKRRAETLEVHTEYLDTKTISGEEYSRKLSELMAHKYASMGLKVVIATDDDAYKFYLKYQKTLFPGVPVVFCGVNYFKDSQREGNEDLVTGVVEAFDILSTLRKALELHPRASRVIVINDKTTTGIANKKVITEEVAPQFAGKVEFVFYEDLTMQELLEKVQTVSPNNIILLMTFNKDRDGKVFNYDQSISLIAGAARAPLYGVWDFYLGKGILGGMLTSGVDQGRMAGEMALRILDGEKVRAIPVVKESPNRYKFDYQPLKRFGIPTSKLPLGSMVINEPASFYSQYKGLVWGGVFSFLGMSLIILLLLRVIAGRKNAEKELRESESKYRRFIDTAYEGIWMLGPDLMTTYVNERMVGMIGYSAEQLLGRPFTDFLFEEDVPEHHARMEKRRQGISESYDLRIRHKNGKTVWAHLSATVIFDEKHCFQGAFAMFTDITERKKSEELLHRLNRELRAISGCDQVLVRAEDEQALLKEICRIICNEAGYRMAWVGYAENDDAKTIRPAAWAGVESGHIPSDNLSWAEDVEQGRGLAGRVIRSGEMLCVQDFTTDPQMVPWRQAALQLGYRSGIALPLKAESGRTFGVLLICSKEINAITPDEIRLLGELAGDLAFGIVSLRARVEHKRAEEAVREAHMLLAQSSRFTEALLSAMPIPVFYKDREGRYLSCNRAFTELMGVTSGEIKGKTVYEIWPGELAQVYHSKDLELMSHPARQVYDFKVQDKDGVIRPVIYVKDVIRNADNQVTGIVGAFLDITERKPAEEPL
ncbi:MAG: PAS domain S-box protein [Candidatus Omnitrophota bacterium]